MSKIFTFSKLQTSLGKAIMIFMLLPVFTVEAQTGTPNTTWYTSNPSAATFNISTADHLAGLAQLVNNNTSNFSGKTVNLTADIDLSAYQSGTGWSSIGNASNRFFSGTFDGTGKIITGLYINNTGSEYCGLFGNADGGTIKNVTVKDVDIYGYVYVGAVVGRNGIVENCHSSGLVRGTSNYVGGIIGRQEWQSGIPNIVTDCSSSCVVIGGGNNIGGIAGWAYKLERCFFTGSVNGEDNVGGIAGTISGPAATWAINCYSTGNVTGSGGAGGIAGQTEYSYIEDCYSAGTIHGYIAGGIVAFMTSYQGNGSYGSVLSCYSIASISRIANGCIGGIVGSKEGGNIQGCAALNSRVAGGGRVYCTNTTGLTGNVGFDNMLNGAGNTTWTNKGFNNGDGEDISVAQIISDGTIWSRFVSGGGWTTQNGKLPGLLGQTVDLPPHLGGTASFSGNGTVGNPYLITTAAQLKEMATLINAGTAPYADAGKYYQLMNDIDLSGYNWVPIGTGNSFKGIFRGNKKIITGLTVNNPTLADAGLFGEIDDAGAEVFDLGVQGVNVKNGINSTGGIAGTIKAGDIHHCYVTGNVSSSNDNVGGILGIIAGDGGVNSCYTTCNVTGRKQVGGLVGNGWGGYLTQSYSIGAISGSENVGGVAGYLWSTNFESCAALNPYVKCNTAGTVGRVIGGSNQMNDNIAFNGIKRNGGASFPNEMTLTGRDGQSWTAAQINADGTLGMRFLGQYSWQNGRLPGLFGQTVAIPPHIIATGTIIIAAPITGITSPVVGNTPATAITATTQYTGTVAWNPSNNPFNYNTIYTATITLTASSNYTFNGDFSNTSEISGFTVNGIVPNEWISNNGTTLEFKVTFPQTETKIFEVSFAGEGINIPSQNILLGGYVTEPPTPDRDDCNFDGWFTDNNTFLNEWNFATNTITQDTTLYARWKNCTFCGGTGESHSPYLICTPEQLDKVRDFPESHFKLNNGIDLEEYLTTGNGYAQWGNKGWLPIAHTGEFKGTFNGAGYKITGLWIDRPTATHKVGLFGNIVGSSTAVKNLGVETRSLSGTETIGVIGNDIVGGLAGYTYYADINNCYFTGSVTGNSRVGGLIGEFYEGDINKSYASADITATGSRTGGLIGHFRKEYSGSGITNCYAEGAINGNLEVGGLIGYTIGSVSKIANSYSTSIVTGNTKVGGLIGYRVDGTFTNCFFDTETTTQTDGVGDGLQSGVTAKTTAQMQTKATFAGWDFDDIWSICEDLDYPRFQYQNINCIGFNFCGGTGTQTDPYLICNAEQLDSVRHNLSAHYKLANDIDLTKYLEDNYSGAGWLPIGYYNSYSDYAFFTGTFNGAGHIITGLWIDRNIDYVGLFGYTANSAKIDSLGVEIATAGIKGYDYVGGLVGINHSTISNCYATGNVSGTDYVGGLVGGNSNTISNCYATGNVAGIDNSVGGLVGWNTSSISNCYATGNVSGTTHVGGLVGINYSTISNCYATGNVNGFSCGGLVGTNYSTIFNCYATGKVSGSFCGGLVGRNYSTIFNCYATGKVTGSNNVGGLVGNNSAGTVSNSFYDYQTTGQNDNTGKGTPKSTAEMKKRETFIPAGTAADEWDFTPVTGIWKICENQTYPFFQWQKWIVCSYLITVAANSTAGGTVTGGGTYEESESVTVTATPNTGYNFVNWTKAGTEVSTDATYNFTATEDVDLVANFALKTYTITAITGANGTISPLGIQTLIYGANITFTFAPNIGFELETLLIDGISVPDSIPSGSYTFYNITGNHTIEVRFFSCLNNILYQGYNYKVTKLVGLCWTENMRNKKYADNTPIPYAKPYFHSQYPDTTQYINDFGLFYTWVSAMGVPLSAQGICPNGWRIPTTDEWQSLNMYDVDDLKNPTFWLKPNNNTNSSGFGLCGSGFYNSDTQRFEDLYGYSVYWSSDISVSTTTCKGVCTRYNCPLIEIIDIKKTDAVSVRCVRE